MPESMLRVAPPGMRTTLKVPTLPKLPPRAIAMIVMVVLAAGLSVWMAAASLKQEGARHPQRAKTHTVPRERDTRPVIARVNWHGHR